MSKVTIGRIVNRSERAFLKVVEAGDVALTPPRISAKLALLGVWVVIGNGKLSELAVCPGVVEVRKFLGLGFRLDRRGGNEDRHGRWLALDVGTVVGMGGNRVLPIFALSEAEARRKRRCIFGREMLMLS